MDSQKKVNETVDNKIVEYIQNNENCLEEILDDLYIDFKTLRSRVPMWQSLAQQIAGKRIQKLYSVEYVKQRNMLVEKSYEELLNDLEEANSFGDRIEFISAHNYEIFLLSLGAMVCSLLYIVAGMIFSLTSGYIISVLIILLGVGAIVFSHQKSMIDFSKLCKYISLSMDYQSLDGIKQHSVKLMIIKEMQQIKDMGESLYKIYSIRDSYLAEYKEKSQNVHEKYLNELKQLESSYDYSKTVIQKRTQKDITNLKNEYEARKMSHEANLNELKERKNSLLIEIQNLEDKIDKCKALLSHNKKFLEKFDTYYDKIAKKIFDTRWRASLAFTQGSMNHTLYVVADGRKDEYGYIKIFEIEHNLKPLVILCDTGKNKANKIEEYQIKKTTILKDFTSSIVRMNPTDIIRQSIIGDISKTEIFQRDDMLKFFNIQDITNDVKKARKTFNQIVDKFEYLVHCGDNIDNKNLTNFKNGDKPLSYDIIYILIPPQDQRRALDEELCRTFIVSQMVGVIPIFIVDYEEWMSVTQNDKNQTDLFLQISRRLGEIKIIKFDGTDYTLIR